MVTSISPFPGKLFRPPLPPDHLPRPALVALLQQSSQRRLILVCAPAGFGKSTLAIEYSEQLPAPWRSIWLSLDSQDGEHGPLLRSLIQGLRTLYPLLGAKELQLLGQQQSHQPLGIDQLVASLLADLHQVHAGETPVLLVLDDYHLIRGPQSDRLCALLLEQLPQGFQLLITGRCRPDWHLARLRLGNQLLEIGEKHLRLSREAAAAFLASAGVAQAEPQWLRHIVQRNEGWIAGLRLLALTAQQQDGSRARLDHPRDGADPQPEQLIGEYLLEEVILQQPPAVQQFLQQIAWFDRFTVELCDHVRGAQDSQQIIAYLAQHQVFLVPLDREGKWYRFHHLFSDVLRERGAGAPPCERLHRHLRACDWFRQQGRITDAVEQALAAERPDEAARLVQHLSLDRLLAEQHVSTLLRWKAELPGVLQGSSARLVMVHAWTLALACQLEEAQLMLQRLQYFLPQPDAYQQRCLIGQALALKGFLARSTGRLEEAMLCCHQALACLDDREAGSRLMAMLTLADSELCSQRMDAARQWARSALELAQRVADPLLEAQAVLMRARLMQARGQVARALQAVAGQRRLLAGMVHPQGLAVRARLTIYHGYLLGQLGDNDDAMELLRQGIEEARDCRDVHVLPGYCLLAGMQALQRGGDGRAFDTLTEAERLMHQWDIPPVYYLGWGTALKSDLWISSGRQDLAEHWLPRLRQTYCLENSAAPPVFFHALPALIERIYARLLWSRGEQVAAESVLRALLSQLQHAGQHLQALAVMTLLVRMLYRLQRPLEAEKILLAALALAVEDGISGPFQPLLHQAPPGLVASLARAPASRLRDRLLGMLPTIDRPDGQTVAATLQDPLSARELDVLRCIAQGYSNQQISEALFISLHTVKSHARRINNKLGVARRTQAVAQAKVLGLLH
ncbi:MAG: LuxR C-terminal-related transcriptional regulator [Halopseudomonas sp.]